MTDRMIPLEGCVTGHPDGPVTGLPELILWYLQRLLEDLVPEITQGQCETSVIPCIDDKAPLTSDVHVILRQLPSKRSYDFFLVQLSSATCSRIFTRLDHVETWKREGKRSMADDRWSSPGRGSRRQLLHIGTKVRGSHASWWDAARHFEET